MENFELEDSLVSLQKLLTDEFSEAYNDMENFLVDYPQRVLTKPHNDPERVLHRKYLELSALVRRLDERNQHLSLHLQKMTSKLEETKLYYQTSADRIKELGNRNMDLNQTLRKGENRIKDMQQDISEKHDKISSLQLLLDKKEHKLKKIRSKDSSSVPPEDLEAAERKISDQLQVIAELRHHNREKDVKINSFKKKLIEQCSLEDSCVLDKKITEEKEEEDHLQQVRILTKENMEIERMYNLLQKQVEDTKDPQRNLSNLRDLQSNVDSLHSINEELLAEMEDEKEIQVRLEEDNNFLKDELEKLEDDNKDLREKLMNTEELVVEKTLHMKSLTEELKEMMDQNDLLELKLNEMTIRKKYKQTEDTINELVEENVSTEVGESIRMKFILKEFILHKNDILSDEDKECLNEVEVFLENLCKEISIHKSNNELMTIRLQELEDKLNVSRQNVTKQEEELNVLLGAKLRQEEIELLSLSEDITTPTKEMTAPFDVLNDASATKQKIERLEKTVSLLKNKLEQEQNKSKLLYTEDEMQLLRLEVGKFRETDLQMAMLQNTNMKRLEEWKKQKYTAGELEEGFELADRFVEGLMELQLENEKLNLEVGELRSQSDKAVAMVNEAKSVLVKCENSTQTPKFVLIPIQENTLAEEIEVEQESEGVKSEKVETQPKKDAKRENVKAQMKEEVEYEKVKTQFKGGTQKVPVEESPVEEIVMDDVFCMPADELDEFFKEIQYFTKEKNAVKEYTMEVEFIPPQFEDTVEKVSIKEEEKLVEEEQEQEVEEGKEDIVEDEIVVSYEKDVHASLDEERLLSDNEFILSVIKEFEKQTNEKDQSVIYQPLKSFIENNEDPLAKSCQTSFDMYLNKSVSTELLADSDAPLSTIPSDHSDEEVFQPRKLTENVCDELFVKAFTTTSSCSDSGITPLSTAMTPRSAGTPGITPRSQHSSERSNNSQQCYIPSKSSYKMDSAFSIDTCFKSSTPYEMDTLTKPVASSDLCSCHQTYLDSEIDRDIFERKNEDITEVLKHVDNLIQRENAKLDTSSKNSCYLCSRHTNRSESKQDCDVVERKNEDITEVLKHVDNLIQRENAKLDTSSKNSCYSCSCHTNRSESKQDRNVFERKNEDIAEVLNYVNNLIQEDVKNSNSSNVIGKDTSTRDCEDFEEKPFLVEDDFLSQLLQESKKIKALAEEIFTIDTNELLRKDETELDDCQQPKMDHISLDTNLNDSKKMVKDGESTDSSNEQCSCICEICQCKDHQLQLPPVKIETQPPHSETLHENNCEEDSRDRYDEMDIRDDLVCCSFDEEEELKIDERQRISCETKMKLPIPPPRRCNEVADNNSLPQHDISFSSNRKVHREVYFLRERCSHLIQKLKNKEALLMSMEEKGDEDLLIESKDKEIQLKSESISQITQMLQKTKKELEIKVVEVNRKDTEIKQFKEEMKRILAEKKVLESSHSENQITLTKIESMETRLKQMTDRCDSLSYENKEFIDRIKQLEITERDYYSIEQNVYDLQVQLRDMEDIEIHRDELIQKLQSVKKQRDDFLAKGKLVEEERNEFVKSNKTLEEYLVEWKRKTTEFKQANSSLKKRILMLEKDKKELEEKIEEIQSDRVRMQSTICSLEGERDDYILELKQIVSERNSLEQRLAELEDMLGEHDQLEEGFHSLRLKLSELTRQRDDAEVLIHTYKTKIQNLKKSVRSKEDIILQLTHDMKTLKVAIENCSPNDIPVLRSMESSNRQRDRGPDRGPDRSTDPAVIFDPNNDEVTSSSEYDVVNIRQGPNQGHSHHSHHHHHHRYSPSEEESIVVEKTSQRKRPTGRSRNAKQYVALFDYDPRKSSTSDYPERELRLKEGDYITVFGEMDSDGYLEAEIDGVRGLIPGIYVEEMSDSSVVDVHHRHKMTRRDNRDHQRIVSRERSFIALYDYDPYTMGTTDRPDLQLSLKKGDMLTVIGDVDVEGYFTAIINGRRGLVPSNFIEEYSHSHMREEHFQGTVEVDAVPGPPYAPRDLKVTRVVTRNAVLLTWLLPSMDDHYYSNGCKVIGYRIWVNGRRKQEVNNVSCNKALVDDVDLNGRVEFSIQTIGEGDLSSEKCHFAITGALSTMENNQTLTMDGEHELYVALYDYDPFKSSPNPNPSLELLFREGDMMMVYDKSRSDGFFFAKMNGKKGLVPSNFIECVKKTSSTTQRHSSSTTKHVSSATHDSDSNSRRVQFESKSRDKK